MTITNNFAAAIALTCALTASSFAHAGAPVASGPMTLGASATPPRAYLEFCSRQPQDCQVSREMVMSHIDTLNLPRDSAQVMTAAIIAPLATGNVTSPAPVAAQVAEVSFSAAAPAT